MALSPEQQEVIEKAREDEVRFINLQFTDIHGTVKSVGLPAHRLPEVLEKGSWFDGSSIQGFACIQESDMVLQPDPATYQLLPWKAPERRTARLICEIGRAHV